MFASFTALSFVDIKELPTDDIVEVNDEKGNPHNSYPHFLFIYIILPFPRSCTRPIADAKLAMIPRG